MSSIGHVITIVMLIGVLMGGVAVAACLLRPPRPLDPNDLAPHDRLGDLIEDDDPELPYGWSGP